MSDGFIEFGFGQNDKGIGEKSEKFKGETGRQYRLSFCWWPEAMTDEGFKLSDVNGLPQVEGGTPKFVGNRRFYFEGIGYILDGGPEYAKLAGKESRLSIATIVVQWPISQSGDISMGRVKDLDFKVLPWIFSEEKYKTFTPIHKAFSFGSHDLTVLCSDSKYQKMTFSPCGDSMMAKLAQSDKATAKKVTAHIIERVNDIASKIRGEIGREMDIDKLREKLVGGGSSLNAAAAAGVAATADIDSLVDDILG